MAECATKRLEFTRAGRRGVTADASGGTVTSDAGLVLLREVELALGLCRGIADCIEDARQQSKVKHGTRRLVTQRVFAIAAGYEDYNDHHTLRDDQLLQMATTNECDKLAGCTTLHRHENRVGLRDLLAMQRVLVNAFMASHRKAPRRIVLDVDASFIPTHGNQERRHFNAFYGDYGLLPLYITCGDAVLSAWLRSAGRGAAFGARSALSRVVAMLRRRWPRTQIIVRADSGFCTPSLLSYCEAHGLGYIIGLAKNRRLNALGWRLLAQANWQHRKTGGKGRVIGEFRYATKKTWPHPRRVIARMEWTAMGGNPRYVVTNLRGRPRRLYEKVYCQRGEMENRIKGVQSHLFGNRVSCHSFRANQMRLTMAVAAHAMLEYLRRVGCSGTPLARAEMGTLRLKLLKIGARVEVTARRFWLRLSSASPAWGVFAQITTNLHLAHSTAPP